MDLIKGITLFLGWLSGSLAGIAAVLYSFGYLVARAQLNLLGLQGLVAQDADHFLQEGAKFLVVLAADYLSPAFPWLYFAGWLLLAALPLLVLVGWLAARRRQALQQLADRLALRGTQALQQLPWSWRKLAFAALVLVLLLRLTTHLNPFVDVLAVADILYATPVSSESQGSTEIRQWLTSPDRADLVLLKSRFGELLRGAAEVALVVVAVWYLGAASPWRLWLALPFMVVLVVYTLLLPMAYGVLVRPNEYPLVAVSSDSPLLAGVRGDLFLLRRTGDEFVFWDKAARRVLWVPASQVAGVSARASRLLFKE
jgi:hypothetical protein